MGKLTTLNKLANRSFISNWLHRRSNAPLIQKLGAIRVERCLEVGCGTGMGTLLINDSVACGEIIVTDLDPEALEVAAKAIRSKHRWQKNTSVNHIKLQLADATSLPFKNGSFDLVFAAAVFHHIREWPKAISEISRVLKPGGKLVSNDAYKPAFKFPIIRWFDRPEAIVDFDQMRKMLTANKLKIRYQEGDKESTYVRFIAQKRL